MSGDVMSAWRDGAATAWEVEVDPQRCVGSGVCVATAPLLFERTDGGSRPVLDVVGPDLLLVDAAFSCPVEAITVRDTSTGVTLVP